MSRKVFPHLVPSSTDERDRGGLSDIPRPSDDDRWSSPEPSQVSIDQMICERMARPRTSADDDQSVPSEVFYG